MKEHEGALRRLVGVCIGIAVATWGAAQGVWATNTAEWPTAPIHMVLLPSRDLLLVSRTRNDPNEGYKVVLVPPPYTGAGTQIDPPMDGSSMRELFCAGHTLDENGDVLFSGGHYAHSEAYDRIGIKDMWLYKWRTNTWERQQDMAHGRWYPTVLQLPNRTFLTMMGEYSDNPTPGTPISVNATPDLWTAIPGSSSPTNVLVPVTSRNLTVYYPHTFIHPVNGRPFYAASGRVGADLQGQSCLFNTETLTWDFYATIPNGFANIRRSYPSSVMMDGVIYRSGGSASHTVEAEDVATRINLYDAHPQWSNIAPMKRSRKNHTLLSLPDGRIVGVAGNIKGTIEQSRERTTPEAYDTESPNPEWQLLQPIPANQPNIGRGYHLCSLLLPDASIVVAGAEREHPNPVPWSQQRTAQIFTPEYGNLSNWKDSRPEISGRPPSSTRYAEPFYIDVDLAPGRTLSKFRLISLGSTTHAFNANQQFVTLEFSPHPSIPGRYTVQSPESAFKATPGFYMLFAVDSARIPSVAHIVQLRDYERRFPSEVALLEGTSDVPAQMTDTVLGDNRYCGSVLRSTTGQNGRVSLRALANYGGSGFSKSRLAVESRASLNVTLKVWLRNTWTSVDDLVATASITTIDRLFTHELDLPLCPYVGADGRIEARLEWESSTPLTPFDVFVDRVEFGMRPVNDQDPVLGRIEIQTIEEGQSLILPIQATDADAPLQTLTYSLGTNAPAGASLSPSGIFSWTPGEQDGGTEKTIQVQVTDGVGSDSASFNVRVLERNEVPTLDIIGNRSVDELQTVTFQAEGVDSDLPSQSLSFNLDPGAPEGAAITANGSFSWTPTESQGPGTYPITVRVSDGNGGEDSETIQVTVSEVNVAPVLAEISNFTATEGTVVDFIASAIDDDLPANGLSYALNGSVPTGAVITPEGHFTWTPDETQGPGTYRFNVVVTDSGSPAMSDQREVTVFVAEQLQGAPVDLNGTYIAPAGPGSAYAATAAKGGERVREISNGEGAPDATFTPFSDLTKPPTEWIPAMSGRGFSTDIGVSGGWGEAQFQLGLEPLASGAGASVNITCVENVVSLQLRSLNGGTTAPDVTDLTGATLFRLNLHLGTAGNVLSGEVMTLDGSAPGTVLDLGDLPVSLADPSFFFAGFAVAGEAAFNAKAVLSNFTTTAESNIMALQAVDPFLTTSDEIQYRFSQSNMAEEVGGYQAYLESHGSQVFSSGSYSEGPYMQSVGGSQYDPIRAILYLARGIAFSSTARLDDALLATLRFQPTGEGSAHLTIRPDNGWGLDTTFADNGLLGLFVAPAKRNSDTVVIDETAPTLHEIEVVQTNHDVLATGLIKQGPMTIRVQADDALSGLSTHPVANLDFEPFGEDHGEDISGPMKPERRATFRFDTLMTLERDCMPVRIAITAVDECENRAMFESQTLEVNQSTLLLQIRNGVTWQGATGVTRALEIRLGSGPGTANPIILDRDVVFDADGNAVLELDGSDGICATHTEIAIKDPLHGLRTKVELSGTSPHFSATVDLRAGDMSKDNKVDIMDYVVLAMRYGIPVSPSTPYPHASNFRHADLDGDGEVGISDYALLSASFGSIGSNDVGNQRPGGPPQDRVRTADAILELGPEVKKFDRNRDGWITLKELGL